MLPEDDEGFERVARLSAFADAAAFEAALRTVLKRVERHYAALFEAAPQLSAGVGNLVFTGDVDDPDTLQDAVAARLPAAERHLPGDPRLALRPLPGDTLGRGARAADRADAGAAAGIRPDATRRRGADALRRVPGRAAGGHPAVLAAAVQSGRCSGWWRRSWAQHPGWRRSSRGGRMCSTGCSIRCCCRSCRTAPISARGWRRSWRRPRATRSRLDRLRIFAAEQKFLIGVRLLTGSIDAKRAGKAFSDLADLTIGAALVAVEAEFAHPPRTRHGRPRGHPRHGQARQPRADRRLRRRPYPALRP